jgi:hypothetical protein
MSIWAYRFGKKGVNLTSENSFRLKVVNNSSSAFTLNLFNLGGGASTQTPIVTTFLTAPSLYINVTNLTNSVFTAPTTVTILDTSAVVISSVNMLAGQTLNDYYALANPIISTNGQVGSVFIEQVAVKDYNIYLIGISNGDKFTFSPDPSITLGAATTQTFVQNNPSVTIESQTNLNFIQNSETTNSLKVIGMDVFSINANQLFQGLNYLIRDSNGNLISYGTDPVIDPYQPNKASLQMINVDDFQIHTNVQFQYTIDANTIAYLNFTYVRFGVAEYDEFNRIFSQQTRDRYAAQRFIVGIDRIREMNIE